MSETTLLDIQSDYIFKRVFGIEKNKKLLISLINAILKGNPTVTNLEIRNSEISKIVKNNLTIYLDIKAEINPQEFVDIEIQVRNTGEIMERAVQYLAEILTLHCRKLTAEEIEAGQRQSYKYPKVIGIWIMGENVTDRKDAVNEACVAFPPTARDEYQIITDKLRIFFVELKKFRPNRIDRQNMLDVWMTFLQNPLNDEIQTVPEVKEALDTLKELSSNREEQEIYYLRRHAELGYLSEKNLAVQKAKTEGEKIGEARGREEGEKIGEARGVEKGKAEGEKIGEARGREEGEKIGLEKGVKQAKLESIKKMLEMGLKLEQISKIIGFSVSEIKDLEKDLAE